MRSNSELRERDGVKERLTMRDERDAVRELVASGGDIPLVAIIFITRQCVKFL